MCRPGSPRYCVCRVSNRMRKRVLIADDSSAVRDVLKIFLEQRAELEICGEAADGLEAVEKATALRPDLVLLDYSMPKMNGAEAASVLKKLMPEIHIILFTMYSEDIGRSVTFAIGVDAVLSKPDGITPLVKAIDAALASEPPPH
jgi:DNA-binding NarL/FixJ family response regulator